MVEEILIAFSNSTIETFLDTVLELIDIFNPFYMEFQF